MRTIKFLIAGATLIAAAGVASAASVSGKITKIDPKTDAITLSDGKVFTLPEGIEAETLKVGETVDVTYSGTGPRLRASKIHVVK
ncbi:hypothetical protein GCM10007874_72750 [Labrys miyagiensis]|uniref:DUF1344 domain-containing protein n=1 Tax=Labrys miyagiensis TaxID=346912 RepID=A0ABQ6CZZ0_9HYPH|nr:DUF1344 domain-containing protein [Labrys miyagiensis]GLS24254.1 hypothetical protein GCM10007874_72750 [Labrys miyagiensis]